MSDKDFVRKSGHNGRFFWAAPEGGCRAESENYYDSEHKATLAFQIHRINCKPCSDALK